MKKILSIALALIAAVCLIRVVLLPAPTQTGPVAPAIALDAQGAAKRLAAGLRIPTVSYEDHAKNDPAQLDAFAEHLRKSFPRVHQALKREVVGKSLLYT